MIVTEIKLKIVFNINYDTFDPNPPDMLIPNPHDMFPFLSFAVSALFHDQVLVFVYFLCQYYEYILINITRNRVQRV